ncbi:hypothetical protein [Spiroplasma tabanidicola]|uniref:Uncharacterized protein n=1 Tax=Spiroplasma tabanidicola TaxID=324079 RepID=A0A6I6CA90_9MOLU|nr:hypothetical protein [Spiroplasma tabanidicola]QGS51831.1 hypothetical protein STABA_v1c04680 [Spiroplasma tabanidicola]
MNVILAAVGFSLYFIFTISMWVVAFILAKQGKKKAAILVGIFLGSILGLIFAAAGDDFYLIKIRRNKQIAENNLNK